MAYATTTDSLFSTHESRIEEVINKAVDVFLPSLDPVWRDTVVSSQGVGAADAIGRDMLITKVFQGGLTGVIENAAETGDWVLFGDTDTPVKASTAANKVHVQNLTQTFPDPTVGANQKPYRLQIPMRALVTNLMMTLGELQAEATPAFIGEIIGPKLEGFAKNISHTLCNYWYLSQNLSYRLCAISAVDSGGGTGTNIVTISGVTTPDRFYPGQRVDIWSSDGTTQRMNGNRDAARTELYVDAVDELAGKVSFVGASNFSTAVQAGQLVVYAGITETGLDGSGNDTLADQSYGIAGMNSWLVTGNDTIDGTDHNLLKGDAIAAAAIDVNVHPEFKSLGITSVGALTEHKLRQYLGRFHAAKNKYGQYIDCLIASDGVWTAYEATKIGREMIDRSGRLSSLNSEGSDEGFTFTFEGRTYQGYSSMYADSGRVYGIRKGGNNWKRFTPPSYKGMSNMAGVDNFVPFNFVGGSLTGGPSQLPIYKTVNNVSLPTEGIQMPGMLRMQLVPDQPAGMILDGCNTDTVFAS
tara:strand:+ start:10187 stop:11764 length:1578 start_codon:yes stop_codon:yes gene_type:complete